MVLFFEVVTLGFILSADSFSAAVAMGSAPFSRKQLLKFAAASGAAEMLAVMAGYFAGSTVIQMIEAYDHWIAFLLLAGVAAHLIYEGVEGLRYPHKAGTGANEHSFSKLVIVSIATSLDAFGVGIGLGIAAKPLLPFSLSIGGWAFASTIAGVMVGRRASEKLGPYFTIAAGIVLGAMSIKMLSI